MFRIKNIPGRSGGFIVYNDTACIVRNTWNFSRFYHHESCGQCSPCREGTGWLEKVLHRIGGITGPNTGAQELVIDEMFVNDQIADKATKGDHCTLKLPFRIRLSDKLYKIVEA